MKKTTGITLILLCAVCVVMLAACMDLTYDEDPLIFSENLEGTAYIVTEVASVPDNKKIDIPSEYRGLPVTGIGDGAFEMCTALVSVTIPDSVTSIGEGAFYECHKLIEVYNLSMLPIEADSSDYGAVGYYAEDIYTSLSQPSKLNTAGEYIFYADGETVYLMGYIGTGTELILPESYYGKTYGVYPYAFYGPYGHNIFTTLTIGDGVTSIGEHAFSGCSELTSVTIGDGVTSIGDDAFARCIGLASIAIPDNVTSIGESAFMWCHNLVVTFGSNSKLTSVGEMAFEDCLHLMPTENGVQYAGKCVIGCDTSVTSVTLRADTVGIGDGAFSGCMNLTSITIPDGVTSIGEDAFSHCTNLTSVTIPDSVTSIGENAFFRCTNLAAVTLGNGVESIGDSAFFGCMNLTTITIPDGVTSIGTNAFETCHKLVEVYNLSALPIEAGSSDYGAVGYYAEDIYTSLSQPSKLTTVGDYVFYTDGDDVYLIGYVGIETAITLPDGYGGRNYAIYESAFKWRLGMTSVTIPDSVTSIGEDAFSYCTNLTAVTLGNGVESIGEGAFEECTALTSVTIPDSVTSIGRYVFIGCTGLTSITFSDTTTWFRRGTSTDWNEIETNVGDAARNATRISSVSVDCYWEKR